MFPRNGIGFGPGSLAASSHRRLLLQHNTRADVTAADTRKTVEILHQVSLVPVSRDVALKWSILSDPPAVKHKIKSLEGKR